MNRLLIRIADVLFSVAGLIIFSPLLIVIPLFISAESEGPFLFRQLRVGKDNRDFLLLKFRTMVVDADKKGLITVGSIDPRITRVGKFLRRFKLDELPQFWNVLNGSMSLVGPRPEVRKYVDLYTEDQRVVLTVKPGITDRASIEFSKENEMLSQVQDPDEYYIREVMPAKIRMNMFFIEHPTFINYLGIIFRTIGRILT